MTRAQERRAIEAARRYAQERRKALLRYRAEAAERAADRRGLRGYPVAWDPARREAAGVRPPSPPKPHRVPARPPPSAGAPLPGDKRGGGFHARGSLRMAIAGLCDQWERSAIGRAGAEPNATLRGPRGLTIRVPGAVMVQGADAVYAYCRAILDRGPGGA